MVRKLSSLVFIFFCFGCISKKLEQKESVIEDDTYYFIDTLKMKGFVVFYSNFSERQDDYIENEKYQTIPVFIEYNDRIKEGQIMDLNDESLDFMFSNTNGRWLVLDPLRVYINTLSSEISNNSLIEDEVFNQFKAYSEKEFKQKFEIDDLSKITLRTDKYGQYYPSCISYDLSMTFIRAFSECDHVLPGYTKVCIPLISDLDLSKQVIRIGNRGFGTF